MRQVSELVEMYVNGNRKDAMSSFHFLSKTEQHRFIRLLLNVNDSLASSILALMLNAAEAVAR